MEDEAKNKAPKGCCTATNVLWYLTFMGFAVNYMIRLNLNIAIVSMVVPRIKSISILSECSMYTLNISTLTNKSIESTTELGNISSRLSEALESGTTKSYGISVQNQSNFSTQQLPLDRLENRHYFDWNEKEMGYILSSFFWLHWATQLPGGILATKYGSKMIFGWSNFLGVVACFFIPWFAHRGTFYLVFIRCLQGLLCGFTWPSMHSMTAKWIPPNERSKFVTAYIGSSVGAGLTYPLCGQIIDKWGWEMVFYVCGIIGTIWFLGWQFLVFDSPAKHPRISSEEKEYILSSLGKTVSKRQASIPWKSIFIDRSVWANCISQIGAIWGFYTLTVNGPTYFNFIHRLNIKTTGMFSGLPHFFRIIFAYLFSAFGDYLLRTEKMSRTNVRKMGAFFSGSVQGIFLICLAYSGCNKIAAVVFMIMAVGVNGAVSTGPLASLVDISPNYSGILLGICNTVVSSVGFVAPIVVGFITYGEQSTYQWRKVFWITTTIIGVTGSYHLFYSKSETASWNSPKIDEGKTEQKAEMIVNKNGDKNTKKNQSEEIGQIMYSNEAIY